MTGQGSITPVIHTVTYLLARRPGWAGGDAVCCRTLGAGEV